MEALAEPWLCPICCKLNDAAVGSYSAKGYCQSMACASRRGCVSHGAPDPVPEILAAQVKEIVFA